MTEYDDKEHIKFPIPEADTTYACTFLPMPRVTKKTSYCEGKSTLCCMIQDIPYTDQVSIEMILKTVRFYELSQAKSVNGEEQLPYNLAGLRQIGGEYEIIEDPVSIGIVHHILIYFCANNTILTSEVGDCYGQDTRFSQCLSATLGWAVGGEPFDYPDDTGISIGTDKDPQYVRIEIHYSNFENKEGLIDNSGIRIYYTPELRPRDSATLMSGVFTFPMQFIPPGCEEFRNYGICDTRLMAQALNETIPDLTVKAYLLHGHLTARSIRVMHYRNGTLIGSLGEDKKYDFSFQQIRNLPAEITVKMGDVIVVECTSNTMDREGVTFHGNQGKHRVTKRGPALSYPMFTLVTSEDIAGSVCDIHIAHTCYLPQGGPSSLNEMCIGFLFYYPLLPIAACWSYIDVHYIAEAIGLERADS
ncbi:unnamed protein product [Ranitomeya imitator]|uniref:Peptidylglycine monooxygenase n=1 Tax=Ranitomeya imitator TaxID=111125 RepID=A0ABN9KPG4_9NEOB|nr:unnamed protein product [Ranitomeya imitator]